MAIQLYLNPNETLTKVFWLFGRSGAGKTTLGVKLRDGLANRSIPVVYLDGDEMRASLCADLGFKPEARLENHRRIAEVARLLAEQGLNVVVSTMAPQYQLRDRVLEILGDKLVWLYIHAPLDVCMGRDPKGLYKQALVGLVKNLINYPFEDPRPHERQHLINTETQNIQDAYLNLMELAKSQLNDYSI